MNCLQAQSQITTFIDNRLEDGELMDFIHHINHCENCKEELEVYYTLIVGMKQLDNNEKLSNNFAKELEEKIDNHLQRIKNKKRFISQTKFISYGILTMLLLFGAFRVAEWMTGEGKKPVNTQSKYYYIKMKPYMFQPIGDNLRNPYQYNIYIPDDTNKEKKE